MRAIAQAIADGIKAKAGGKVYIVDDPAFDGLLLDWRYDCPCGEVSGYSVRLDPRRDTDIHDPLQQYVRYHIDVALACMRRHVRSEGNEPSF